mgnify:CR=1 FL=1
MYLILLLSLVFLLSSCTKTDEPEIRQENAEGFPIAWEIVTMDEYQGVPYGTKALIEDYNDLRDACTILETHDAEKIGLFGSYTSGGNNTVVFDDVDLWWWDKENGNPYPDAIGDRSQWNYEGEDVYWETEADYVFKAYFPKSLVNLQPGSGSNRILTVYDSQVSQYDFLVAHKEMTAGSENPVRLLFRHALAAIKFNFQFINEGVTDRLTACWLENVQPNGLYTSSTLNFEDSIIWPKSTANPVGVPMYYWKPVAPLQMTSAGIATAYSTPASSADGNIYTQNDGWLLVIPQPTSGPETLQLCFRTVTGADVVYRTGLPALELQPGKRYTYLVKVSSTRIELHLTIADWNERDSSYEIDFNK